MTYPDDFINKVIQGDCLDVMKQMPDKCVDLVVTSPPYDGLRDYHGYSFDFEGVARELWRVIKDGGVVVWVVGDATVDGSESGTSFRQALFFKEVGFNLHDTMIYLKKDFPPLSHNRYEQQFEYMFVLSSGKPKTFNGLRDSSKYAGELRNKKNNKYEKGSAIRNRVGYTTIKDTKMRTNVWLMSVAHTKLNHPAIFPEKLAQDHIISWSNEGDIVLDPFNGSGTTTKSAKQLGRNFIGIELSEKYCEIARQRLRQDTLL